mmetsp:Transcript_43979/g.110155  ORF Transcript_43979/g.110155 Transcript_43979/m.110155 type:complete len:86 (-) Transcript_43979:224-481(-)
MRGSRIGMMCSVGISPSTAEKEPSLPSLALRRDRTPETAGWPSVPPLLIDFMLLIDFISSCVPPPPGMRVEWVSVSHYPRTLIED